MGGAVVQIHKELEEASEISGRDAGQVFWLITLPLLRPSFLNGWLWVCVHALRESTLAVMLMTPANIVLASMIWAQWREGVSYGPVAAMSIDRRRADERACLRSRILCSRQARRTARPVRRRRAPNSCSTAR